MRFIGNKEQIVNVISELLKTRGLSNRGLKLFDAFCGSGAVSNALRDSFDVTANDALLWCTVYTRGRVVASSCTFSKLGFDPFDYLNSNESSFEGFMYRNYSPGGSDRMYFTAANAARIDYFRNQIEEWKDRDLLSEDEYAYLISSLIESVSSISNTAGVYGAFLKHWDPRALNEIIFVPVPHNATPLVNSVRFLNNKIEDVIPNVDCDILYLDPPYTQNQYGTQYHLLETLVLNDEPEISRVTGSRSTRPMRSDWSKAYKAHVLFDRVVALTRARYVMFSYSSDGIMSKSFIEACLKRYAKPGTYVCQKISYRKYTNFKSRNSDDHFEYLFFIEKLDPSDVIYESPLNYIGGKSKLIQGMRPYLPFQIGTLIDVFGGGFNFGINVPAGRTVYNDINGYVVELIRSFRENDTHEYILYLKNIVRKYGLEPQNGAAYNKLRALYNSLPQHKRDPRLLLAIVLYGYNQQIRFNSSHEFNNPVGMRWFNDSVLEKLISYSRVIKEMSLEFNAGDYESICANIRDESTLVYCDPPYMFTVGSYNDGKRGFAGWDHLTEQRLLKTLDQLNNRGVSFMLSYVIEHNGKRNTTIEEWVSTNGYNLVLLPLVKGSTRKEILIMNYHNNG